jgi:hypothetical protein
MKDNVKDSVTRGKGFLEPFLARQRAQTANQLIPPQLRQGRILDIGCGTYPYFLAHTEFEKKFAIDQLPMPTHIASNLRIEGFSLNLNLSPPCRLTMTFSMLSHCWQLWSISTLTVWR